MGIPVDSIPFGSNCSYWSTPAETPGTLFIYFWGIIKGDRAGALDPPNLHVFHLSQLPGQPCVWGALNPVTGWAVQIGLQSGASWLWLWEAQVPARYYFSDSTGPQPFSEYETYANFYQIAAGNWGYAGHGTVFWMAQALDFSEDFGLVDLTALFLEPGPVGTSAQIIKLCDVVLRTNIKIKFIP